jgi:hypothetical protein
MMIRKTDTNRNGTVTVVAAVSMIGILSIVALSLDGGVMIDKRRQIQAASDAAALAGCCDLYKNWYVNKQYNPEYGQDNAAGTAKAAALNAAKKNGFENGVNGCTVTVNIPPTSGVHNGKAGHVEVLISHQQKRYFSKIFGSTDVPVGARAVARGYRSTIKQAILVLNPTQKSAFNAGGNGNVSVTGSPIQVNSTDPEGMIANGGGTSGSISDTEGFNLGGSPGWTTTGGATVTGPKNPNSEPIPDPLAQLPAPTSTTVYNKVHHASANPLTIYPGVYNGGISVTGKGDLIMRPGIYIMQGGGFSVTGQGNVTGLEVMIYNNPASNSDTISIAGSGVMKFTPPTSGPYQGILLFQNRTSTAPVSVSGGSGSSMAGLFYAAKALMKITGGGGASIGSQYISDTLTIQGNGNFSIDWSAATTPGIREIYLVE